MGGIQLADEVTADLGLSHFDGLQDAIFELVNHWKVLDQLSFCQLVGTVLRVDVCDVIKLAGMFVEFF